MRVMPIAIYLVYVFSFPPLVCSLFCFVFRFRMFSLADASGERTALVALRNCLYLIPLGYLAYDCEYSYSIVLCNYVSSIGSFKIFGLVIQLRMQSF